MRPGILLSALLLASAMILRAALPSAAASPSVSQLEDRASQIVSSMASGDFASVIAQADPTMNTQENQSALQSAWTNYEQIMGDFQSTGQPAGVSCSDKTVEQVPVQFANGSGNVTITFDQNGTLDGLYILAAATPIVC